MTTISPPLTRHSSGSSRISIRRLSAQTDLDHLLYNTRGLLDLESERHRKVAVEFIAASFRSHHERCEVYRRLCTAEGVEPASIRGWDDLPRIPLIPAASFKRRHICSVDGEDVVKLCTSSGTRGGRSIVARDHVTLERFIAGTGVLVDQLLAPVDHAQVFNLGPDDEEAGDLWIAYVLSAMQIRFSTRHYVSDDTLRLSALVRDLRAAQDQRQCIVVGPPVLFLHLVEHLEAESQALDLGRTNSFIVTAGGWKRFEGSAISRRELTQRLCRRLGLGETSVRDAFNMVELNTVLLECERNRKHIPPWLVASARDPSNLRCRPDGEPGLLAFLDASARSYPGFVLSDDIGWLDADRCPCGRRSPTLQFERRVERVEARGCALKLDRHVRPETTGVA